MTSGPVLHAVVMTFRIKEQVDGQTFNNEQQRPPILQDENRQEQVLVKPSPANAATSLPRHRGAAWGLTNVVLEEAVLEHHSIASCHGDKRRDVVGHNIQEVASNGHIYIVAADQEDGPRRKKPCLVWDCGCHACSTTNGGQCLWHGVSQLDAIPFADI